jgi:YbbR domain-containing protein
VKGRPRIWLIKLTKKGVSNIDKDIIVFAFFLFLSFVFWYLNSLNKEIESNIRYPVRYVNLPRERILEEDLPAHLDLYLKGAGYSVLKLRLSGNRAPVILDISSISYRRVTGSSAMRYYIRTSSLIPKLSAQLRTECTITAIKPDTLFFTFDRVISKEVPVIPDIRVLTDRQYSISGFISSMPEKVKITGPKHIVDTVAGVRTKFRKFTGVNRTLKRNLSLKTAQEYTVSERKVTLTIPVQQFTEAQINVPVKILNCPDSVNLRIFPDAVTVKGLVSVTDYKKFRELPFDVVIDIAKTDLRTDKKLPVELRNVPPFINSIRVTPADVDFLIEKK